MAWRLFRVSNHQPHYCLLNRLFRCISKKISKLRVAGLCEGNSPWTGEFPSQRASNAENISLWSRHRALWLFPYSSSLLSFVFSMRQAELVYWPRPGVTPCVFGALVVWKNALVTTHGCINKWRTVYNILGPRSSTPPRYPWIYFNWLTTRHRSLITCHTSSSGSLMHVRFCEQASGSS